MATDRDPFDAIADVACPHVHHHAMCAPCAADAIRPELERALLVRNAANAMAGVQQRRADRLRKELEHAKAALAGDNEGIRLWMLTCAEATERHRQNAARSEAATEEAEADVERLTKERDALKAALLGALETYRIHRQVRHPEPLADCITCGMGASIVNHLPPHLCAALTHPTEGTPSA